MFFDGRLDGIDLAAIDEEQRKRNEKLAQIVDFVLDRDDECVDIRVICSKLNIKPTRKELSWIQQQIDEA